MRLALAYAKAGTIEYGRYTPYSIPTLALPAVLMLIFGHQVVDDEPERMVAGFAATALITVSLFQFGVGIAMGRVTPWETYLRTLPAGAANRSERNAQRDCHDRKSNRRHPTHPTSGPARLSSGQAGAAALKLDRDPLAVNLNDNVADGGRSFTLSNLEAYVRTG